MTFRRIAIVNRGEPAMRLINAVGEYNAEHGTDLRTIALFTDPDARAMFVREAHEQYHLGSPWFTDAQGNRKLSYLDYARLEAALVNTEADAAWVGWGFVAEHAEFATLCKRLGVVFIGPAPDVMEQLGDKIASKRLAERAGVPVAAWSGGAVATVDAAREVADHIGYPLMVKATAGGGGRGIRRVDRAEDLEAAFASARSEARSGFGDDTVFMERLVTGARHIEVQIIGDVHGTVWPVGVRDCSVQRRNQKLLEEAPSPALSAEEDVEVRTAAARLGAAAGYHGAGTVEFLFEEASRTFSFMEVNTRLQVEHPITEVTTGVDMVKLQLHVARGGRLEGHPPPTVGHSIEARLNAEDADRGFAPAPGVVELLRFATGPGIRIDTGIEELDEIAPEFDSMVAKVIAVGATRAEARGRLDRALAQSRVVVREGTTNKAFLRSLLQHDDFVSGRVDVGWVDRLLWGDGALRRRHAAAAVIAAAITAYGEQLQTEIAKFRNTANHGRPEITPGMGQSVKLRLGRQRFELDVREVAPARYRIRSGAVSVEAAVEPLGRTGFRLRIAGNSYRVLSVVHGATHFVEVDGVAHRITHDEGGVIRAPSPAVVVSVEVAPGDAVAPGDRLAVIEAMKMETVLAAEFAGIVRSVEIRENTQVATGTPLIIIDPTEEAATTVSAAATVDLGAFALAPDSMDHRGCHHYLDTLRWMLLGWDVAPEDLDAMAAPGSERCPHGAADAAVRAQEDDVIAIFVDVVSLFRRALPEELVSDERRSTEEYLFEYLRELGAHRGNLPNRFTDQLLRTLQHYGIDSIRRTTPELVTALFRITKSHARMAAHTQPLLGVLDDRLNHVGDASVEFEELLTRLIHETQGRYPAVHDIAQELRYRAFDMPFLETVRNSRYAEVETLLERIDAHPDRPDRADIIGQLVDCPQPLKPTLSRRFASAPAHVKETLLEVMTRRYYRIRKLGSFTSHWSGDFVFSESDYPFDERRIHVISTHLSYEDLGHGTSALRRIVEATPADHDVVVDIYVRRSGPAGTAAEMEKAVRGVLDEELGSLALRRIVVVVSGPDTGLDLTGVVHFTFRPNGSEGYREETEYRDLHPMMGKRLDLWRLSNFRYRRLPSLADVFFFHAVAKDNPRDERLFALGEVRDLTAIRDDTGKIVRVPEFERIFRDALGPIRHFQARQERRRLQWNRVMLYVWPVLTFTEREVEEIVYRLARETEGLGLERVQVRVRMRTGRGSIKPRVIEISNPGGRRLRLRLRQLPTEPMQPLSAFDQTIVRLRQRGLVHPAEVTDMLAPSRDDVVGSIPHGRFDEYDLDGDRLVPVERPPGGNPSNVVVGVVSNFTDRYPEGMERVIILGDPTRGMGNLAAPECRRIIAAMDLAEDRGVPLEWFALSAGARIAMDSGTENMDWIGRVLRRIVEFTQRGHELNLVVMGINVGAQPYWNAEATMLMHTKGVLIMTPNAAMVLTGKQALDYSGGVSAEDNRGIGGYERIMGPNGQAQYLAHDISDACRILLQHYEYSYMAPGESTIRRAVTADPLDRDVRSAPHGGDFATVGDVFSDANPERKLPFEIRRVMDAVRDDDLPSLERWHGMQHAEMAVVWDAFVGGYAVTLLGLESKPIHRLGFVPADGPLQWTAGTLFPVASKKVARAINAASGSRPLVVLANLSGFDGSPESMRRWQLEYGAEIGRAIVNFDGPIVFCVVSRYHGGAFVVFSKTLNDNMEVAALEGAKASVIGGAPAAAVVFTADVRRAVEADSRIVEARRAAAEADGAQKTALLKTLDDLHAAVTAEKQGEVADAFDHIHSVERARDVGSIDRIIPVAELRPYLIGAIERGFAREAARHSP